MPVHIDATAFLADLEALKNDIHAGLRTAYETAATEAVEVMRGHGYNDRTGNLSRTMYSRVFVNGLFAVSAEVVAPAEYALYVDKPTKPHPIDPRGSYRGSEGEYNERGVNGKRGTQRDRVWFRANQQCLRWYENGVPVFRRKVDHPGTKGAFFSKAVEDYGWRFSELCQQQVDSAVARHA